LPAANIMAYSVGLLLSEIAVRSSIEEVMINPLFWVGIAVMAASAALLIVTNKYLRLCVLEILGVLTLRIVEPTVRHAWLFGVDPWWHYGLVEAIRGNNAVSIDDFLYPSKGSQVLMANVADLLQIDTLAVMRFFYIPFSIASGVLLFLISLRVFRSYRFACVSVLFLAVGQGTYISLMPQTYGITLLLGVAIAQFDSSNTGGSNGLLEALSCPPVFSTLTIHAGSFY